jgi:hypothetical protein
MSPNRTTFLNWKWIKNPRNPAPNIVSGKREKLSKLYIKKFRKPNSSHELYSEHEENQPAEDGKEEKLAQPPNASYPPQSAMQFPMNPYYSRDTIGSTEQQIRMLLQDMQSDINARKKAFETNNDLGSLWSFMYHTALSLQKNAQDLMMAQHSSYPDTRMMVPPQAVYQPGYPYAGESAMGNMYYGEQVNGNRYFSDQNGGNNM